VSGKLKESLRLPSPRLGRERARRPYQRHAQPRCQRLPRSQSQLPKHIGVAQRQRALQIAGLNCAKLL